MKLAREMRGVSPKKLNPGERSVLKIQGRSRAAILGTKRIRRKGVSQMRQIRIRWEGPLSVQEALGLGDQENDYGLYQIYGRHIIFGPGALLYLGRAREQTFGARFRQHVKEWLSQEEGVSVRVGRIPPEDYADEPPEWPDWSKLLTDAEALEIFLHSPPYNSSNISEYRGQPLHVFNEGERGSLILEFSSDQSKPRPKDETC